MLNFWFDSTKLSKSPDKDVMPPTESVRGNFYINQSIMKTMISICGASFLVLLLTMQDMDAWFWMAAASFTATLLVISNELDNIENQKK